MKQRMVVLAIGAVALAVAVIAFSIYSHRAPRSAGLHIHSNPTPAQLFSDVGVMSEDDYNRLTRVQNGIWKTGNITETDLAWALALMNSKPLVDSPRNEDLLHRDVLNHIMDVKHLSSGERDEMFKALLPYASESNNSSGMRMLTVIALGRIGDRLALPYLRAMQSDPDTDIRGHVERAINKLS